MLGAIAFLIFFLLIASQTRGMIMGAFSNTGDWIVRFAPFSFIILAILLTALLAGLMLMVRWPKTPEPVDPMAQYKKDPLDTEVQ